MSFCKHCGKQIQDNMRFCKYCGTEVKAASQPAAAYVGGGEEQTVFMGPAPAQQVAYQEPPREEGYPVVAVFDAPKKKKSAARWVVPVLAVLLLAGGAACLLYNDNYKAVLSAVGLWREQEPETAAAWTEPATAGQTQTASHTDSPLEFNFPEETLPPIVTTAGTQPGGSGMVAIPPTRYRVDTNSPIEHTPLRIRIGPSVEFDKIGSIPDLAVVIVTQIMDDWAYVTYEGVSGWAYMGWMVPIN